MFDKRFIKMIAVVLMLAVAAVVLSSCVKETPTDDDGTGDSGKTPVEKVTTTGDDKIELTLVLPKPVAGGTERTPNVENMQETPESARPVMYVPAGTTNVALGKPVTATDDAPIGGGLEKLVDGDVEGTDGSGLEFGLFDQNVTVDLGSKHEMYAIMIWHYFAQTRVYYDVVVQIADDADFTQNSQILFNNDTDNSLGLGIGTDKHYKETLYGKLIDAKGAQGRFVRFHSNGNDVNELNHYIEVAVYGKPVE